MHQWVKGHAGVSWGQPEGSCLEMRRSSNAANATEHYAAAGALVCTENSTSNEHPLFGKFHSPVCLL